MEKKKIRLVLTESYWLKSGNIWGIFLDFLKIFFEHFLVQNTRGFRRGRGQERWQG